MLALCLVLFLLLLPDFLDSHEYSRSSTRSEPDIRMNLNRQFSQVQFSTAGYSLIQSGTVKCSQVQFSTSRYSLIQSGTVKYSKVQCSTDRYSLYSQV